MAHFAELDDQNVVKQVVVVDNQSMLDDGVEKEGKGIALLTSLFGGLWKQCSYNGKFRKNYPGPGYTYDARRDAFIGPRPFASWTLAEDTCRWAPPTPYPADGERYMWDERTATWVKVT